MILKSCKNVSRYFDGKSVYLSVKFLKRYYCNDNIQGGIVTLKQEDKENNNVEIQCIDYNFIPERASAKQRSEELFDGIKEDIHRRPADDQPVEKRQLTKLNHVLFQNSI